MLFVRNRRKNNKHFIYIHTKQYHNMCLYAICFPTSSISHKKDKIYVAWLHGNNHFEASLLLLLLFWMVLIAYTCVPCMPWATKFFHGWGYMKKGQKEKAILCKCFAETNDLTCSTPSFNNTFCYKSVRMMKTLYFREYISASCAAIMQYKRLTNLLNVQRCRYCLRIYILS